MAGISKTERAYRLAVEKGWYCHVLDDQGVPIDGSKFYPVEERVKFSWHVPCDRNAQYAYPDANRAYREI